MRPARTTSKTVYLNDNIFANFIFDTSLKLKKGIIQSDVYDHFPVLFSINSSSKTNKENFTFTKDCYSQKSNA